jgi:hypothetical protein
MEVYHPHGIHHGRKLKDYIIEFIMLFVAISGGFFMENMRESLSDRHKEKEYIVSMVKELEKDTSEFQWRLKYNQTLMNGIDTLYNLLEKPILSIKIQKVYEYTFKYLNQHEEFTVHNTTLIQLKNSSGLRLIRHKSVADSIVNYYLWIDNYLENNGKIFFQLENDNVKLEMHFLDFGAIETNKMRLYDTTKLVEFRNRAYLMLSLIHWENIKIKEFNAQATSLLKYLKKEYKLSD